MTTTSQHAATGDSDPAVPHGSDHEPCRTALKAAQDSRLRTLSEIRAYAINRHERGDICREGLDEFLAEFNLASYDPRLVIEFTVRGTYEVRGTDPDAARMDAERYLIPDLGGLDDVVDGSEDYTVEVHQVRERDA